MGTKYCHRSLRSRIFELWVLLFFKFCQRPFVFTIPISKAFHSDFSSGDVPVATWSFRACMIQGSQNIYLVMLWFWGSRVRTLTLHNPALAGITIPLAVLIWITGIVVYVGLPDYYCQEPGKIPSFYRTVPRRKIILVSRLTHRLWMLSSSTDSNMIASVVFRHGCDPKLFSCASIQP